MANDVAVNNEEAEEAIEAKPWFETFLELVPAPVCFGLVIGFMAALSTFAGTASTLIGLLFVLVGREAMSWFKPEVNEYRTEFFRLVGLISIGLFAGLWIGFLAKSFERAAVEGRINELKGDIAKLKENSEASTESADVSAIVDKIDGLAEDIKNPIIRLNSLNLDSGDLLKLADEIEAASNSDDLSDKEKTRLSNFASSLRVSSNLPKTYRGLPELLHKAGKEGLAVELRKVFQTK